MGHSDRLRVVMHPLILSREIQPYIALLADALSDRGINVEEYRTTDVVMNPPDVIHFHWPEHVLALSPLRKLFRSLLLLTTLRIARIRGATLVLTAHNVLPHDLDATGFNGWFLRAFDNLVDGVLIMSRAGWAEIVDARPGLAGAVVTHTRHGDFKQAYPPPVSTSDARRMLGLDPERPLIVCPGQVRRYKGVPELLDAARDVDVDVLVAGSCTDEQLRRMLERRAQEDERIHLRLVHLSAETLAYAISAASVVALPYRKVLNSGSAILALSLSRPVLVPPSPSFLELRDEVGKDWVMVYSGEPISSNDLKSCLAVAQDDIANLDSYRWVHVAWNTEIGYWRAIVNRRAQR